MATFDKYGVGLRNVGSYQVSGWPWITGSAVADGEEVKVSFPMVTKSITLIASGAFVADDAAVLRAHFASTSAAGNVVSGHHYITMEGDDDSLTLNVKCKEIYISAVGSDVGFEVVAELTNVPTGRMFELTGSGHTD